MQGEPTVMMVDTTSDPWALPDVANSGSDGWHIAFNQLEIITGVNGRREQLCKSISNRLRGSYLHLDLFLITETQNRSQIYRHENAAKFRSDLDNAVTS